MTNFNVLTTLLIILFLAGCNSSPFVLENHQNDFNKAVSEGLQRIFTSSGTSIARNMCGELNYLAANNGSFTELNIANNTVEKSDSIIQGMMSNQKVHLKKSQFNGIVQLVCLDIIKGPVEYNNLSVSGVMTIYQPVDDVDGKVFEGKWQIYDMNYTFDQH